MSKKFFSFAMIIMFLLTISCGVDKTLLSKEEIVNESVYISGITKEYDILFFADSHISECDNRDSDIIEKAKARKKSMSYNGLTGLDHFNNFVQMAKKEKCDLVIMGGDIVDSAMYASIEAVEKGIKQLKCPYVYVFGNHDFEYGTEYFSQNAYEIYRKRFERLRDNSTSQIREFDEFVVVTADDDNNQVTEEAYNNLLKAIELGKPIIIVTHVPFEPLVSPQMLLEDCIDVWGPSEEGRSRVTIGDSGKTANDITQKFIDLAFAEDSPVAVVLAGHIHFYHKDKMNSNIEQIITGAAYEGKAISLQLIPAIDSN